MRYHCFLHYGWFFQNLGKEAARTFMHTTVIGISINVCTLMHSVSASEYLDDEVKPHVIHELIFYQKKISKRSVLLLQGTLGWNYYKCPSKCISVKCVFILRMSSFSKCAFILKILITFPFPKTHFHFQNVVLFRNVHSFSKWVLFRNVHSFSKCSSFSKCAFILKMGSFSKCAFILKMWKLCERFREFFFIFPKNTIVNKVSWQKFVKSV